MADAEFVLCCNRCGDGCDTCRSLPPVLERVPAENPDATPEQREEVFRALAAINSRNRQYMCMRRGCHNTHNHEAIPPDQQ